MLAENGKMALAALARGAVDLLISDIKMPDMSGVDVLRNAKQIDPALPAIMMTAFASTETAVEAMRLGACDYLVKPFDVDELKLKVREKLESRHLRQENLLLKRALNEPHAFAGIIGRSSPMLAVFDLVESVARTTSTVLITGESGTGKELVARALHQQSLRRDRPFVAINCGALTETLLESELFGHMKGSFTGADATKKGLIEGAEGGTIFLDEIGETTPMMQVKLLRVLQERKFRRVGGLEEIDADIRVVAATNQDLAEDGGRGPIPRGPLLPHQRHSHSAAAAARPARRHPAHRRSLPGEVPADHGQVHRDDFRRGDDAAVQPPLAGQHPRARKRHRAGRGAGEDADHPGRQPARTAARAGPGGPGRPRPADVGALPEVGFDLEQHVQSVERRYLAQALERAGGVQVRAAELLGMSFRSFRYYAKKYNLK